MITLKEAQEALKIKPDEKAAIEIMAQELADNLNKNVSMSDFDLTDLCKCGHTFSNHPALKRYSEPPRPIGYTCTECECKKFDFDKKQ